MLGMDCALWMSSGWVVLSVVLHARRWFYVLTRGCFACAPGVGWTLGCFACAPGVDWTPRLFFMCAGGGLDFWLF